MIAHPQIPHATVLVIEDDPDVRAVFSRALENAGYTVLTAGDGDEGLRLCRELPVDVVVTDILMPVKDGLQAILDLQREFPRVRVVAISGGGSIGPATDFLRDAKNFGAASTLQKPVLLHELVAVVGNLARA